MSFSSEILAFYLYSKDFAKIDEVISYAFKVYFLEIALKIKKENQGSLSAEMTDIVMQCIREAEELKLIIKCDYKLYLEEFLRKAYSSLIKEEANSPFIDKLISKKYKYVRDLIVVFNFCTENSNILWIEKRLSNYNNFVKIELYI